MISLDEFLFLTNEFIHSDDVFVRRGMETADGPSSCNSDNNYF